MKRHNKQQMLLQIHDLWITTRWGAMYIFYQVNVMFQSPVKCVPSLGYVGRAIHKSWSD